MEKKELQYEVGKRIKYLREKRNISQQDLAGLCNFEKANFSRIENGNTNPTLFTLYKIANNLNITIAELVDFNVKLK